jgi:Arc/MetJ-type ribon-helix-helix transcriptional regulator
MNVTLTPKSKRLVEQKVKSGSYKNADDVVGDALRLMEEKDRVSDILGSFDGSDIEEMAIIVFMQAARDAEEDLKEIMNEMKAMNAAKRKLRELQKKIKCDIANSAGQPRPKFDQNGLGSERAYHHALIPVPDLCSKSGVKFIETDLYKGRIVDVLILEAIRDDLSDKLDGMSEMSEMDSLRLQMMMDRRSRMLETLSNIMKKISSTAESIVDNLK